MELSIPYPGLLVVPGQPDERTLGWQLGSWIETMLCHGVGDVQGEPIELDDELQRHLVLAYALDEHGRRRVTQSTLCRLKGRAKSEFAAWAAFGEWVGPCRFDHWAVAGETSWWGYEYERGEPVGRPVRASFVRCLATEETQAGNTYDNILAIAREGARVMEEYRGLDIGETRSMFHGNGRCEVVPSTASDSSKDGGKETFCVFDEVHLYNTPQLRRMYTTVRRNGTKRKDSEPWFLLTTTMHDPSEDSVGKARYDEAVEISRGTRKNLGVLFDHRCGRDPEGTPGWDWEDDVALRREITVAAGDAAGWMDIDRKVQDCREPDADKADSLRYHLNLPTSMSGKWLDFRQWAAAARSDRLVDGDTICLGFDGARFNDSTWVVASRCRDRLLQPLGSWIRPERAPPDWEVPSSGVLEVLRDAFKRYRVVLLLADPPHWFTEVEAWQQEFGGPDVVRPFQTNRVRPMWDALERFTVDLRVGELTHCGDTEMSSQVLRAEKEYASARADADGKRPYRLRKPEGRDADAPGSKIDAAVAGVLAHLATCTAHAEGLVAAGSRRTTIW